MYEEPVIVVSSGSALISDRALLHQIQGSLFPKTDTRFTIILILTIISYAIFMYVVHSIKLQPPPPMAIEDIPDRYVKLIIEKPLPKAALKQTKGETAARPSTTGSAQSTGASSSGSGGTDKGSISTAAAKKAVAKRAAVVETKMRTVGVLGMLTGVGTTAKGPAVIDVLGSSKFKKGQIQDLDKALENVSGLKRADEAEILSSKLVRSKEVTLSHKETIDNLVSQIATPQIAALSKKGNVVIQRPESIEGAASSSAKRDDEAINKVVATNKTSIRMSYEKFLARNPQLAGKITVRFTIAASGQIIMVEILENSTGDKDLENDIISKVKMWRFESITEGDVTVTYPFVFSQS